MKKYVILAMAGCGLATPALAQEADEWNGAYIGVSAGYNAAKSQSSATLSGNWSVETQAHRTLVTNNAAAKQSFDGVDIGGQIGYNANVTENVVAGIEAEASYHNGKDTDTRGPIVFSPTLSYTFVNRIDPKFSGAIKAKLGLATGPTLVYATGGWGWTRASVGADISGTNNYLKTASRDRTFDGYVVGGGIEHKFSKSLSARFEYTYADRGSFSYQTAYRTNSTLQTPARGETYKQDLNMHQVRVGLNFHF